MSSGSSTAYINHKSQSSSSSSVPDASHLMAMGTNELPPLSSGLCQVPWSPNVSPIDSMSSFILSIHHSLSLPLFRFPSIFELSKLLPKIQHFLESCKDISSYYNKGTNQLQILGKVVTLESPNITWNSHYAKTAKLASLDEHNM